MTTISVRVYDLPPGWKNVYRALRQEKGYDRVDAQIVLLAMMAGVARDITFTAPAGSL